VCAEVRELAALGLDRSRHVPESSQDAGAARSCGRTTPLWGRGDGCHSR
jgi:hypothetical protein